MSALTVIQNVTRVLKLPVPSAVVTSTDDSTIQLLGLLNRSGRAMVKRHAWSELSSVITFSGANASQVQTGYPQADWDRFTSRIWDTGLKKYLAGPFNPQDWVRLSIDTLGTHDRVWTLLGGVINILPVTATTDTFRYSQVSKYWVNGSTDGVAVVADADTFYLPEELLTLDLIWRWKQAKGLDYAEDMMSFELEMEKYIAADRGPKVINTARAFRNDEVLENTWPHTLG
jgi:hypothetical protein